MFYVELSDNSHGPRLEHSCVAGVLKHMKRTQRPLILKTTINYGSHKVLSHVWFEAITLGVVQSGELTPYVQSISLSTTTIDTYNTTAE